MRLLLLAEHADTGAVSLHRAQCWPASTAAGQITAAVGAAYRTATGQAPTSVHAMHAQPGSLWPALIRRAIGPLADLTTHTAAPSPVDWAGLVRYALTGLDTARTADLKQISALAEHATTRTMCA
ncbi:hypothetical protein ABT272_43820 [Streptomyces sp900105245]|uniref:Uncharacterized protein n=1 Tax=Streptomyces sp. 900105245 TaxID=3154379 RepID=A0ABV1ULR6_9ACTN